MTPTKTQRRRAQRKARTNGGLPWHGGKWIRPEKRLRIYARDGWRCVWCGCCVKSATMFVGSGTEADVRLATLDHVLPRTKGGSNDAGNLVTSCAECNEERGERSAIDYAWRLGWCAMHELGREDRAELVTAHAVAILDRVIDAMGRGLPKAPPKAKAA